MTQAFRDLYFDFTGAHAAPPGTPPPIGRLLTQAEFSRRPREGGPLILVTSTHVLVYDGPRRLAAPDYRDSEVAGFTEVTALSHVGPAIAYLARMNDLGDATWKPAAERLLAHLRAAAQDADTVARIPAPSWDAHRERIREMIAYGCAQSIETLENLALARPREFTLESVQRDFLAGHSDRFPVPFNHVMIGTFALAALEGIHAVYRALPALEWPSARVVIRACAGTNYTAGLTVDTSWLAYFLQAASNGTLPRDRIVIAPHAEMLADVGKDPLSPETFAYYTEMVWGQAVFRERMAATMYGDIETIAVPTRPPLPGDYEVTKAADDDAFLARLKHSLGDRREMLSNTIAFWMAGELRARGWDPARIEIPGLTTGFPPGLDRYPAGVA